MKLPEILDTRMLITEGTAYKKQAGIVEIKVSVIREMQQM